MQCKANAIHSTGIKNDEQYVEHDVLCMHEQMNIHTQTGIELKIQWHYGKWVAVDAAAAFP